MTPIFKKKPISELQPNDIVLHPIYRLDGMLFINRYKKLTSSVLSHIKKHLPKAFPVLIVKNEEELGTFLREREFASKHFIQELTNLMNEHQTHMSFPLKISYYLDERVDLSELQTGTNEGTGLEQDILMEGAVTQKRFTFSLPVWNSFEYFLDSARLQERAKRIKEQIIQCMEEDDKVLSMLQKMKDYHDVLYIHSVNTSCFSVLIGLTLELSEDALVELFLATLFADIGFVEIPKERFIQYLDYGVDKEKTIQLHIKNTLKIVTESSYLHKKSILMGIVDHHEEFQGTGYPLRKKGSDISLFGRIIAISQAYDQQVGGYIKESSMNTFDAHRSLWLRRGNQFDPDILGVFYYRTSFNKVGRSIMYIGKKVEIIGFSDFAKEPLLPKVRFETGEVVDMYTKLT